METLFQLRRCISTSSSYRTYEEWKRVDVQRGLAVDESSYRTYEEWKPGVLLAVLTSGGRSYRTYEEWKRQSLSNRMKSE